MARDGIRDNARVKEKIIDVVILVSVQIKVVFFIDQIVIDFQDLVLETAHRGIVIRAVFEAIKTWKHIAQRFLLL